MPTSVLIAVLARPIIAVIYQHGLFTAADTRATAVMLVLYLIGAPFVSALRNLTSVFYACRDARLPMIASFISVGTNIAFNLALMGVLGHRAFPLSASIAAVVNFAILLALLPRKIGSLPAGPLAGFAVRLVLASAAGGGAAWVGAAAAAGSPERRSGAGSGPSLSAGRPDWGSFTRFAGFSDWTRPAISPGGSSAAAGARTPLRRPEPIRSNRVINDGSPGLPGAISRFPK